MTSIPRDTVKDLEDYRDGKHPYAFGSFLTAVLANDLVEAFLRADDNNLKIIHKYVEWMRWNLPMRLNDKRNDMWGSYEAVRNTIERQKAAANHREENRGKL
jgi:hypothetical protein